jgi:hypothetical protein
MYETHHVTGAKHTSQTLPLSPRTVQPCSLVCPGPGWRTPSASPPPPNLPPPPQIDLNVDARVVVLCTLLRVKQAHSGLIPQLHAILVLLRRGSAPALTCLHLSWPSFAHTKWLMLTHTSCMKGVPGVRAVLEVKALGLLYCLLPSPADCWLLLLLPPAFLRSSEVKDFCRWQDTGHSTSNGIASHGKHSTELCVASR